VAQASACAKVNLGKYKPHRLKPVPLVLLNARLASQNTAVEVCRASRGGRGAAARGESRADEFAPGDGGISAGRISRSGKAAGFAAAEKTLVAPDTSMARNRRVARRGGKPWRAGTAEIERLGTPKLANHQSGQSFATLGVPA